MHFYDSDTPNWIFGCRHQVFYPFGWNIKFSYLSFLYKLINNSIVKILFDLFNKISL